MRNEDVRTDSSGAEYEREVACGPTRESGGEADQEAVVGYSSKELLDSKSISHWKEPIHKEKAEVVLESADVLDAGARLWVRGCFCRLSHLRIHLMSLRIVRSVQRRGEGGSG